MLQTSKAVALAATQPATQSATQPITAWVKLMHDERCVHAVLLAIAPGRCPARIDTSATNASDATTAVVIRAVVVTVVAVVAVDCP